MWHNYIKHVVGILKKLSLKIKLIIGFVLLILAISIIVPVVMLLKNKVKEQVKEQDEDPKIPNYISDYLSKTKWCKYNKNTNIINNDLCLYRTYLCQTFNTNCTNEITQDCDVYDNSLVLIKKNIINTINTPS